MLVPLLARGNRQRIESQVISFSVGDPRYAVLRQSGLPVHEVPLSRQRFSPGAFFDAKKILAEFKPDVLHAWGSTAQIVATQLTGGKTAVPIVWSVSRTAPRYKNDGWVDRKKFGLNLKRAPKCERIVYPSAISGANYRRVGFPESKHVVIAPGVDADRYKPDESMRQKVRDQLELPKDAVVATMYAPFVPESDYGTFIKAIGELIRINPNLYCVLAGRGATKGNAALSQLVGGGLLGTRTRIIGEWTDLSSLFNASDVVCSTATSDGMRLTLAISMLCGVMCAATSVGAQGEVIGGFGASVESGSVDGLTRGIRRILEMTPERRAFMAQSARRHILQNFNMARSIEKFHELYIEIVTGEAPAAQAEITVKEVAQSEAAQIIASRAATTLLRTGPAEQPAAPAEEAGTSDDPTGFGSVAVSDTPVQPVAEVKVPPKAVATPTASEATLAAAVTAPVAAPAAPPAPQSDVLEFENYVTSPQPAKVEVKAETDVALSDSAHWDESDAKLLDDIMVTADPATAKAMAAKEAAAARSSAAKAAASAALTAALTANPDSARTLDPKLLAAALNLGSNAGAAARPVAGKAPPAPSQLPSLAPKLAAEVKAEAKPAETEKSG
jgi:glycosyltransferase involved in cell wall biosynthesis